MLATGEIRQAIIDAFGKEYLHEHLSEADVEPNGKGIQTVTFCVASRPTHRRLTEMEMLLKGLELRLRMKIERHFEKEKGTLMFGVLRGSELITTNADLLRVQRMEVDLPPDFDTDTWFELERTNKVIFKPWKRLLNRCVGEPLPALAVTPQNGTLFDKINMLFVR